MSTVDVVFMGSEDFSLPILHALAADSPDALSRVVGVVTQPDRPAGRGRKLASNPVKAFACTRGIPVLQPERLREEASVAAVLGLQPDLVVVASYGQIIPRALLDAPRHGSLNLHPSLLPRYRGASPITGPILAGDRETGTTLMLMRPRMDAGPIIAQEVAPIGADETAGELEARLALLSADLLMSRLEPWLRGEIQPAEQDEQRATYTTRLEKVEGAIDWDQPADTIARRVRAFNPWPTAYTFWDGRMLRILRAHALPGEAPPGSVNVGESGPMTVGTGGGLLSVDELQLAGGRPVAPDEFLRGHRSFATATLGGMA
jgi:methionyl-tRNA formyltransferase